MPLRKLADARFFLCGPGRGKPTTPPGPENPQAGRRGRVPGAFPAKTEAQAQGEAAAVHSGSGEEGQAQEEEPCADPSGPKWLWLIKRGAPIVGPLGWKQRPKPA